MKTSDFLVIGAGVAGLSFALRAAEHGKVAVITKGKFLDCSSAKAQGGIAAVWDRNDSFEDHVADTLDAGAGLCNEQAVRTIVEEGPDAIRELLEWGVNFDPGNQGEDYELAREGGHTKRRILHAKDATGLEITSKLLEAAKLHPNIELLEDHFAIDLITTTKLGLVTEDRVLGAYVLDRLSGEVEIFRSDRVLLATGGCGRVYLYTTNNDSATGDGVAMAWRAGATIANMEFVQFHPTCFFNTRAEGAEARSFLISEAVRGEGGVLIGADGKEFMHKYDPRKSLAPRDITARAVDSEMKRTGSMCVYLDISHKPEGFVQERFPLIYETCNRYGVNPAREPIPVVPAAHFQCGGVLTDVNGQTSLDGLYAAGETGCTGLHGANRLASNSLIEAVVYADQAAKHAASQLASVEIQEGIPDWDFEGTQHTEEMLMIIQSKREMQAIMSNYVGIVRSNLSLERALRRLSIIYEETEELHNKIKPNRELCELRNMIAVAYLVIKQGSALKESVGCHYNSDYPKPDNK